MAAKLMIRKPTPCSIERYCLSPTACFFRKQRMFLALAAIIFFLISPTHAVGNNGIKLRKTWIPYFTNNEPVDSFYTLLKVGKKECVSKNIENKCLQTKFSSSFPIEFPVSLSMSIQGTDFHPHLRDWLTYDQAVQTGKLRPHWMIVIDECDKNNDTFLPKVKGILRSLVKQMKPSEEISIFFAQQMLASRSNSYSTQFIPVYAQTKGKFATAKAEDAILHLSPTTFDRNCQPWNMRNILRDSIYDVHHQNSHGKLFPIVLILRPTPDASAIDERWETQINQGDELERDEERFSRLEDHVRSVWYDIKLDLSDKPPPPKFEDPYSSQHFGEMGTQIPFAQPGTDVIDRIRKELTSHIFAEWFPPCWPEDFDWITVTATWKQAPPSHSTWASHVRYHEPKDLPDGEYWDKLQKHRSSKIHVEHEAFFKAHAGRVWKPNDTIEMVGRFCPKTPYEVTFVGPGERPYPGYKHHGYTRSKYAGFIKTDAQSSPPYSHIRFTIPETAPVVWNPIKKQNEFVFEIWEVNNGRSTADGIPNYYRIPADISQIQPLTMRETHVWWVVLGIVLWLGLGYVLCKHALLAYRDYRRLVG
jgi:hypothetical protein